MEAEEGVMEAEGGVPEPEAGNMEDEEGVTEVEGVPEPEAGNMEGEKGITEAEGGITEPHLEEAAECKGGLTKAREVAQEMECVAGLE
ncbi:hypothetical protein R1flu_012004 [Riccia fluitans]|uniref:Uncharacterized protein n=1 Tax=Riccia fluitans TaxID=41844 RepID=A0ABD1ZDI7_9MARC